MLHRSGSGGAKEADTFSRRGDRRYLAESSADVTVVRRVPGRLVQRRSQSRPKTGRTSGTKP
jgi:hypothetical protein